MLISNTTTDKCTVAKDIRKLRQQGFLSTRFSLLTLAKLIISFTYLIPNDWKQIKYMNETISLFLSLSLISPRFFEKFIFELEAFSYSIGMGLTKVVDVTSINVSSTKFTILICWSPVCTPLIPCYYH